MHHFVHEQHLLDRGLRNYWGYHTIGYFAPHHDYSSRGTHGHQVQEFKQMVKTLHTAGIEVILDVVYNHTAEGNEKGPTLSMRGIDNQAYYRLVADDPQYYMDYTGTGNTLNMRDAYVLQLVMDSLRYWATEMHVDGFRFDLASALARSLHEVDRLSAFFDLVQQDPVISRLKLIAEPWDIGEGGYQVGNFPAQWAEWNGRYRDCIRDTWAGNSPGLGEFAYRITGSSDLYEAAGRRPHASINFVTAHDGFTLRDLVSYNDKHNDANGEDGNDGESHNRSWNCGVEGPTDDAEINTLRARQQRNLLSTLLLSQGVPMILGGDELGRTQGGNNNGYCQDNEISWYDWEHVDTELLDFARRLIHFRREHKVFRRRQFFQGRELHGEQIGDVLWYNPNGAMMSDSDWDDGNAKALAVFLSGYHLEIDGRGNEVNDESFLLLFNAAPSGVDFELPGDLPFERWAVAVGTETGVVEPPDPGRPRGRRDADARRSVAGRAPRSRRRRRATRLTITRVGYSGGGEDLHRLLNDYDIVVNGLAALLQPFPDLQVVELHVGDVDIESPVDVALFDTYGRVGMPWEQLTELVECPRVRHAAVFTFDFGNALVERARNIGVHGYLWKGLSPAWAGRVDPTHRRR